MKLGRSLERLQEKLRIFDNFQQTLDQTAQQIKIQTQDTESQMKREFKELHQFLHNEEAFRIIALREEEEQKSRRMKEKIEETSKHISSLRSTIRDIEQQMKTEDVSFLQNFRSTLQRAKIRPPYPQNATETISVPKHLSNLKPTVLQKMQDNMKTSYFNAELSGDLHDTSRKCNSAQSRRSNHRPPLPPKPDFNVGRAYRTLPPLGTQFQPRGSHRLQTPHPPEHNYNGGGATSVCNFPPKKRNKTNKDVLGNVELQNQEILFPGVKNLVKKINEQMKM